MPRTLFPLQALLPLGHTLDRHALVAGLPDSLYTTTLLQPCPLVLCLHAAQIASVCSHVIRARAHRSLSVLLRAKEAADPSRSCRATMA